MKARELRDLTDEELLQKEKDLKEELFNLKFRLTTSQLDNPMKIRQIKRDIARIKTILRERELQKGKNNESSKKDKNWNCS